MGGMAHGVLAKYGMICLRYCSTQIGDDACSQLFATLWREHKDPWGGGEWLVLRKAGKLEFVSHSAFGKPKRVQIRRQAAADEWVQGWRPPAPADPHPAPGWHSAKD